MSVVRPALPLLSLSLFLFACSNGPTCEESAPVAGGAEQPLVVRLNEPYHWVDATLEQTRAAEVSFLGDEEPLPADHPATKWLQAWADAIDELVRAETVAALGTELQAPKPVLMVIPTETVNALAAPIRVQIQEPIGEAATILPLPALRYPGGPTTRASLGSIAAMPRPATWTIDDRLASYLEDRAQIGNVELVDGRLGYACSAEGPDAGLVVFAHSPVVRFTTSLVRKTNESGALFTLAHELAHYYRAHLSPGATPTYWFENAAASTWEPPETGRSAAIDLAYRAATGEAGGADPALVTEARANGFSFMTAELQADRLAGYLLTRLGFDASAQREAFAGMHTVLGELVQEPIAVCADLAANDYRDASGAEVFMPEFPPTVAGALQSGHPSLCYRGFDLWRQSSNGAYELGTRPTPAVGTWADAKAGL